MLVSSKVRDNNIYFEVHKQGLQFLRQFRNKRLRIIFNVTHQPSHNLQEFNAIFLNKNYEPLQNSKQQSNLSELRVSEYYKQLSDNRVLIFLNAYQNTESTHLLILGYLVASVFLYHNEIPLSDHSSLSIMLSLVRKFLTDTEIYRLQEQIKYKSGCSKKPYFMCLFQQENQSNINYHDLFREFYKFKEGNKIINQSVEALIDYFPQRSAINIGKYKQNENSKQIIKKLGQQYIQNILGRQIFNFEITGTSLQNLCFQLCELFNNKVTSIDLLKIYNKIITNQKTQVFDYCIEKYSNLTNQLTKNLPYELSQLLQSHYRIQEYIIGQCVAEASNCMIFSQFVPIHSNLTNFMKKKLKQIKDSNKQMLRNRALACYQTIQEDQQLQDLINNLQSGNAVIILQSIQQKIKIFASQNIFDFNTHDMLNRLISKYFQAYGQNLSTILKQKQQTFKQQTQRINKLILQNKCEQTKIKQLENQFIYLNSINNQYKQKLLNSNQPTLQYKSVYADNQTILELKKKIMELQVQLHEKNETIQTLSGIFDKFQLQFNRKYFKPKFNKDVQNLLTQITSKSNQIFTLFSQLKKTQQYYQDIQSKFEKKKKDFNKQRQNDKQQIVQVKQKLSQAIKQRNILQQILQQSRKAINAMKNVQKQDKQSINQLQNGFSKQKCVMADIEGQFQNYKKGLQLVAYYCTTGKSDKLRDFIKVLDLQQLKQILKPILKR